MEATTLVTGEAKDVEAFLVTHSEEVHSHLELGLKEGCWLDGAEAVKRSSGNRGSAGPAELGQKRPVPSFRQFQFG